MSWHKRQSGVRYYYRTMREGPKTTKVYIGRGPRAQEAARLDESKQQNRLAAREAWQAEQLRTAPVEAAQRELRAAIDVLVKAELLVAGYYLHHGIWRRRGNHGRSDANCDSKPHETDKKAEE
jgi:hypothetical protein